MSLQEEDDQGPTTQEEPHPRDQYHGSIVAPQYCQIV